MRCRECGLDNPDGSEFCCFCGAELPHEEKHEKDNTSDGGVDKQSQNENRIRILPILLTAAVSIVLVIGIFNIRGCSDQGSKPAVENVSGDSESEEAAAKKKAEEEAAARKKAEEEAAAKKKAEEEAAAKKKAEEEAAAKENSVPAISMDGIETISASSWKSEPEYGLYHVPENMVDGDLSTGWCEDAGGDGIGETVYLYFDKQYKVTGMDIYPGYHKSQDLFEKNGVPVKIKITGDHAETFTLNDEMKSQKLTFSEPMLTEKLTIEILKVRSGSKYKDTLITDIKMY